MKEKKRRATAGIKLTQRGAVLLILFIYIAVILLGISFILCVPFFNHHNALLAMAETRGSYTLTNFTNYPYPTFGTEFYLFREDGELVTSERLFLSIDESNDLTEYLPELLESGQIYKIKRMKLGGLGENKDRIFCIIAGKTVTGKTGVKFASLIIRDLNDISTSIITFAGLYSILFISAYVLIRTISKQHGDLMKMQRDLVSNVSHELKTPITSIRAMAELLYDGMYNSEEDKQRYTLTILQETDRLKDLVKEILDLARLQSHKVEMKKEKCYADGIFTPVMDRYMMLCGDLGMTLTTSNLDLQSIPALYTDAAYIVKVMNILLDNAVKFAGPDGEIVLSCKTHPHRVTFCVSDNGPGIDGEKIDRIFERFYKADVTHNSQGSGLGLSIASEIIEGLGEKIWVESIRGVGTSFFFTVGYK